jgi:hypothetical protein
MRILLALFGIFGIVKKELKYKKTDQEKFLQELTKCSILLTRKRDKSISEIGFWKWLGAFFSRAIQAVTNSTWDHSFLYLGKIKDKHIIIESQEIIRKDNLDKYLNDEVQLKAWSRPLTAAEQKQIILEAEKWEGSFYDIFEIVHHLLDTPHPHGLVVCSSYMREAYKNVEVLNGESPSPGDLDRYFILEPPWSAKRNNC